MKKTFFLIVLFAYGGLFVSAQQYVTVGMNTSTCFSTEGIDSYESALNFSIFPNPNDGKFYLSFNHEGIPAFDLSIFSTLGHVLFHVDNITVVDGTFKLEVSSIPDGVYFISLHSGNGVIQKRFVKL